MRPKHFAPPAEDPEPSATVEAPSAAAEPVSAAASVVAAVPVTRDEIARLAYSYWEARGCQGGSAEEDWLSRRAGTARAPRDGLICLPVLPQNRQQPALYLHIPRRNQYRLQRRIGRLQPDRVPGFSVYPLQAWFRSPPPEPPRYRRRAPPRRVPAGSGRHRRCDRRSWNRRAPPARRCLLCAAKSAKSSISRCSTASTGEPRRDPPQQGNLEGRGSACAAAPAGT